MDPSLGCLLAVTVVAFVGLVFVVGGAESPSSSATTQTSEEVIKAFSSGSKFYQEISAALARASPTRFDERDTVETSAFDLGDIREVLAIDGSTDGDGLECCGQLSDGRWFWFLVYEDVEYDDPIWVDGDLFGKSKVASSREVMADGVRRSGRGLHLERHRVRQVSPS